MALAGESIAQIAYQAGFRGEDLVNMVAIAGRESGWDPNAHRTDQDPSRLSGDRGLWQINSVWDKQLIQAGIIKSPSDLFDPVVNARAAMYVMQNQGYYAWGVGAGGWTAGGDPMYKTNVEEARRAVQTATSTGLIGTTYQGGAPAVSNADTTQSAPFSLPSDAQLFSTIFGDVAIFTVAPGVHIQYLVSPSSNVTYDRSKVQNLTNEQWLARFPKGSITEAGDAAELATIGPTFGTFGRMWESIIGQVMGYNNPAKDDPGVLKVIAEFAARPDMSEAELQNKLQATEWFQTRTQEELEWNSISEAERAKRMEEMEARMVATVFQFMGVDVDPNDPRISNHIEQVASGKLGYGAWTQIIKDQAGDMEESPWARQVREEQEAQRQRPIDIENTSQRIRETSERWGVGWSAETIQSWAKKLVEKTASDEDLIMELRNQAQVLYPWKDPEVETATAAAPWLETYRRVMEKSATINTPDVQRALQAGQPVFDFETALKKSDGWLETKNGQDTVYSAVSELGARMGFV